MLLIKQNKSPNHTFRVEHTYIYIYSDVVWSCSPWTTTIHTFSWLSYFFSSLRSSPMRARLFFLCIFSAFVCHQYFLCVAGGHLGARVWLCDRMRVRLRVTHKQITVTSHFNLVGRPALSPVCFAQNKNFIIGLVGLVGMVGLFGTVGEAIGLIGMRQTCPSRDGSFTRHSALCSARKTSQPRWLLCVCDCCCVSGQYVEQLQYSN